MAGKFSNWEILYLGWSGFHIFRHEGPHFFIDPPKATVFPDTATTIIFITHGHPEHLGGTLDLLAEYDVGRAVTIIASKVVCRFLAGRGRSASVNFIEVGPGQKRSLAPDMGFEVFQWRHMPLLPPGFAAASRHIVNIVRKFRGAWQIIRMSLQGPRGPGQMLGYLLRLPEEVTVIIYGEGLHRRCSLKEVAAVGAGVEGAMMLVASEPEDFAQLPRLVTASGAGAVILYEPHRQWRDLFCLPHVDMKALQKEMEDAGIVAKVAGIERQGNGVPKSRHFSSPSSFSR